MPTRFIGRKIEVVTDGAVRQPVSFTWKGMVFPITDVLLAWADWGFPQGSTQRDWKNRRHRNYYRVETTDGNIYEIYVDRGPRGGRSDWYLYQEILPDEH